MTSVSNRVWRWNNAVIVSIVLLASVAAVNKAAGREMLNLAGTWRFEADPKDEGLRGGWWGRALRGSARLPSIPGPRGGSTGNSGSALWYERDFVVPAKWSRKRIVLFLERPQEVSMAWLDGLPLGTNTSPATPHFYEIGSNLTPGAHRLTVRVSPQNVAADVKTRAGNLVLTRGSEYTERPGIFGRVELQITSPVFIESAQVYPNVANTSAEVALVIRNATGEPGSGDFLINGSTSHVQWNSTGAMARVDIKLRKSAATWSDFSPTLQHLTVELRSSAFHDRRDVTFGLREAATNGRQLLVNEHAIFLRGTAEYPFYDSHGSAELDAGAWKQRFTTYKTYGLNFVRFVNWCPPDEAFQAADETGMYLSVQPRSVHPEETGEIRQLLETYGNHPSFLMMQSPASSPAAWVAEYRSIDSRHLYVTTNSPDISIPGQLQTIPAARRPVIQSDEYQPLNLNPVPSKNPADAEERFPAILNDLGGWSSLTGSAEPSSTASLRRDSGMLQVLLYKAQIEAALKSHDIEGFDIASIHDLVDGGLIPIGMLTSEVGQKTYFRPQDFRRFCNNTVLIATLPKRIWFSTESLDAEIEVAYFGTEPIRRATTVCALYNKAGEFIARGELPPTDIYPGTREKIGHVVIPLANVASPGQYRLVVAIKDVQSENDWNVWVYPNQISSEPANVIVTHKLDESAWAMLKLGRRMLLVPDSGQRSRANVSFAPRRWAPQSQSFESHGLGISIDASHRAFSEFPTDTFAAEQWEDVLWHASALNPQSLNRRIKPIVEVIEATGKNPALLFECSVWKGRLMVCGCDLESDLGNRPATSRLRHSLLSYMAGPYFNPPARVERDALLRLLNQSHQ